MLAVKWIWKESHKERETAINKSRDYMSARELSCKISKIKEQKDEKYGNKDIKVEKLWKSCN